MLIDEQTSTMLFLPSIFFLNYVLILLTLKYVQCNLELSETLPYTSEHDVMQHNSRCETITVDFCKKIEYNQTIMPNLLNHHKQSDAAYILLQFLPLVKVNCNPDLHFFLCTVFIPFCSVLDQPIPPCRSLCLNAKKGCDEVMNRFQIPWPEWLNCTKFPGDKNDLCVSKNTSSNLDDVRQRHNQNPISIITSIDGYPHTKYAVGVGTNEDIIENFGSNPMYHEFVCPYQFKTQRGHGYSFWLNGKLINDCGLPCDEMFFTNEERQFAKTWVGSWSAVCFLCCIFTVLTFMINMDRFRYPERPIIFLSLCSLMVSLIYLIGYFSGDRIACRKPFPSPSPEGTTQMVSPIAQGTKGEWCTILFIGLYFFSMASSIWWVILALTWFLAAGLKWGHEAIEANSQYFHLAAWALPAIKTITILAIGKIEGDVLTGVCFVGVWDTNMLCIFVLVPLTIYLTIGTIFLVLGYISLFRIRRVMKHDGTRTDKLEKLMIRIGIFSLLYIIPAVVVIGCLYYEQSNFHHWMISWQYNMCMNEGKKTYLINCPDIRKHRVDIKPNFIVFMVKHLMSFIVGITSSIWIWSGKTVSNWKELFYRLKGDSDCRVYV